MSRGNKKNEKEIIVLLGVMLTDGWNG